MLSFGKKSIISSLTVKMVAKLAFDVQSHSTVPGTPVGEAKYRAWSQILSILLDQTFTGVKCPCLPPGLC